MLYVLPEYELLRFIEVSTTFAFAFQFCSITLGDTKLAINL